MAGLITKKLMGRLVAIFLVVTLVPLALIGYLSDSSARSSLYEAQFRKLTDLREEKSGQVRDYLAGTTDTAKFLADNDQVVAVLTGPSGAQQPSEAPIANQSVQGQDAQGGLAMANLTRMLTKYVQLRGQYDSQEDILIVRPDGQVILTINWLADFGTNLASGDLSDSGLAKAWASVMKSRKPTIIDFTMYKPTNSPAAFVGVPVQARISNELCGVLVIRLGTERLNKILKVTATAGKTAQAYLIGEDGLMRSLGNLAPGTNVLTQKVDTSPAKAAFKHEKGHMVANNYQGSEVFVSYGAVGLNEGPDFASGVDFDWTILVEMDESEALQPVVRIAHRLGLIALVIVIAVVASTFFIAKAVAKPITAIADQVDQVSRGDLTVEAAYQRRSDEIGQLAQAFQRMVNSMRHQTRQIVETVEVLSSSAAEISTSVVELAMNTSKTSSAVTQTSATVEQVKQAAEVSSVEAKRVAEAARQSLKVSQEGTRATEDTMNKINLIKGQMDTVRETVIRLDEHSRRVEGLIGTIRDLSDQSNLLAVNASIEAARVGDQGKGFAVVAQEIKALADESKQATQQARKILEEDRKWVDAVIAVTEQGNLAVEVGIRQSHLAASSIQALAKSVSDSFNAAGTINISIDQQFIGVGEVATAMDSVDAAMQQNVVSASHLEGAAHRLQELGGSLHELVQKYRT